MGQPVTLCGASFWTAVESATEEDARLGLRDVQTSRKRMTIYLSKGSHMSNMKVSFIRQKASN